MWCYFAHMKQTLNIQVNGKMIACNSLQEASQIIKKATEGKSATRYYSKPNNGNVYENGVKIAHVSFNGKVWQGVAGNEGNQINL